MKMGLGTVQFGKSYGLTNKTGQISFDETIKILKTAHAAGIRTLDTAPDYGESETILGQMLASRDTDFEILTKTSKITSEKICPSDGEFIKKSFDSSLNRLHLTTLYGLLIHDADDLLKPGAEILVESLKTLVSGKKVQKIGVSVYTGAQIDGVLAVFKPDIIQIPFNVFDQRLVKSGHLKKLKSLGIEIHARSIFLQGLLLLSAFELDPYFDELKNHFESYANFLKKNGLNLLQGALAIVKQSDFLDQFFVGVCSNAELNQILEAYKSLPETRLDFSMFAHQNEKFLDPRCWKRRVVA